MNYEHLDVTTQEEEAWKELEKKTHYWEVYSDGLRTYNPYNTLKELCEDLKIEEHVVFDAIRFNHGVWGAYKFVAKQR